MNWIPQWLSLILISIGTGIGLLWIFSKTSDQAAIRRTKKKLQAHLLEMRLYADDPGVIFRAQWRLLTSNLKYIGLMLKPAVIVTVPMVLLLIVMDGYYGRRPLQVGEQAIVTMQMKEGASVGDAEAELDAPPGINVETPGVRVPGERQVSWRIRPMKETAGDLWVISNGTTLTKDVVAGGGPTFLSERRVGSFGSMLLHPGEAPLDAEWIDWIELEYPPAQIKMFGIEAHWLIWFLVFSMVVAFLLKGKFRVTI